MGLPSANLRLARKSIEWERKMRLPRRRKSVRLISSILGTMQGDSTVMVQLGGLEPPTSCSTDRRSNQLSYNCILARGPAGRGGEFGRKLGATRPFGKAVTQAFRLNLGAV
jgi:hypothetical protein